MPTPILTALVHTLALAAAALWFGICFVDGSVAEIRIADRHAAETRQAVRDVGVRRWDVREMKGPNHGNR